MATVAACVIALAFGYIGSMPLAGPVAVMVVSRAARARFGEALRVGLGASLAESIYAGVAFWGYTALLARHPLVLPMSHGVTAVVLVILGVRFAFWKPKEERDRREHKAGTVLVGFSVSAANPTLLVTWGAAVAFLYSKGLAGLPAIVAAPFGACAGLGVAAWAATLVALLRKYEGKLPRKVLTWTVRLLGTALVGLGIWSGVQLCAWLGNRGHPPPARAALSLCFAGAAEHAGHRRGDRDA